MFQYTFSENAKILTPFVEDFKQINHEFIQTADCIKQTSTYPNGFVLKTTQYSDRVKLETNKELIDNGDGSYSVKL